MRKELCVSLDVLESLVKISGASVAVSHFIPGIGKFWIEMNGALEHRDGPSRFVLRQHQPPSGEPGQMLILLVTLESFIHGLNCGHDLALAAVRQPVNDKLLFRSSQTPGSERFATFSNLLGWV